MDDEFQDAEALICGSVYLLTSRGECYRCKRITRLFALMALPPFELVGDQDEPEDADGTMLRDVGAMPQTLAPLVTQHTNGKWHEDYSSTAGERYWMNHCEWCDASQGDFFVHGPSGPFSPYDDAGMAAIEATKIDGPHRFEWAGTGYSGAMADWRDRRHGVIWPPVKEPRKRRD